MKSRFGNPPLATTPHTIPKNSSEFLYPAHAHRLDQGWASKGRRSWPLHRAAAPRRARPSPSRPPASAAQSGASRWPRRRRPPRSRRRCRATRRGRSRRRLATARTVSSPSRGMAASSRSVQTTTQADAVDATCCLVAGGNGAEGRGTGGSTGAAGLGARQASPFFLRQAAHPPRQNWRCASCARRAIGRSFERAYESLSRSRGPPRLRKQRRQAPAHQAHSSEAAKSGPLAKVRDGSGRISFTYIT